MNNKKEINTLLKNICNGDYAKAKTNVSNIIESKVTDKIKTISKKSK